jgi:ribosomal protein S18 acetylase RimI-like enzyme
MTDVERQTAASPIEIEDADAAGEEARFCLAAYFAELAERFEEGFDPARGVSAHEPAMVPPYGCFLIVRLAGRPIGCAALRTLEPGLGEIKRMWVSPEARGLGIARRLLGTLEARGREMGMDRICLDTNRALTQAQALYRSAGYRPVERFNDNPYADFWFEKDLVQ